MIGLTIHTPANYPSFTRHALLLPFGRFLSPRNGRGEIAVCPGKWPGRCPQPRSFRVQSSTVIQSRRGAIRVGKRGCQYAHDERQAHVAVFPDFSEQGGVGSFIRAPVHADRNQPVGKSAVTGKGRVGCCHGQPSSRPQGDKFRILVFFPALRATICCGTCYRVSQPFVTRVAVVQREQAAAVQARPK